MQADKQASCAKLSYYGRDLKILERREQIKQKTMLLRRKQNHTLRLAEKAGKVYMGAETLS
jgi:hypothetical protein